MYDLLDRPVTDLAAGDRFLLGAMRGWVHALTLAGEPQRAVAGGFGDHGGADGCDAFDTAMRALDAGTTDTLTFQRPCFPRVGEDEAVVLGLWRQVFADRFADATATARLLVGDAAAALVGSIAYAAVALDLD